MSTQDTDRTIPVQGDVVDQNLHRRRQLIDAVRILPWLALILFVLPAILVPDPSVRSVSTSGSLIYFIGCWTLLIAAASMMSRGFARDTSKQLPEKRPETRPPETLPPETRPLAPPERAQDAARRW